MGDSTDNIKGCPKIGPKTAEKILRPYYNESFHMEKAIFDTYQKAYPNQCDDEVWEIVVLVGRLVYIRRHVGELWEPLYRGYYEKVIHGTISYEFGTHL